MRRYGGTRGCGNIIEQLIGKTIASDLREITRRQYKVASDLGLDTSGAIVENLVITAFTSSPSSGADPLGCHIYIYNERNPAKGNTTNVYVSA